MKDFLKSFSSSVEEHSEASFNLTDYTKDLNDLSNFDVFTLQSLAFVAGYSVYSYLRHSKCESCLKILSEAKNFEIEEDMDSKYTLISLLHRGSLIWPHDRVLESTIYIWKILVRIEQQQYLMEKLISEPSRKIFVQLAVQLIDENESEAWRERDV